MARGRQKKQVPSRSRPGRYGNGYGTVYMIDKTGCRRKPFVVKVPIGFSKPKKEGEKVKYVYKTIGYATSWEEGDAMLKQFHDTHADGFLEEVNLATFKEVYELAIPRKLVGATEATRISYEHGLALCFSLHDMPVMKIKTVHMQKIIDGLREDGKSTSTFTLAKKVCSLVFDYAIKNDLADKNYASFIDLGRSTEPTKKVPFTKTEIKKLFSNDTVPYANTVLILLFTGIRLNEFISIKTENVHLKERYFITGSKTDAGKNRIIPISRLIEQYISDMYDPDNEFLFSPFNDGTIVTKARYRHMFDTVMQQLNMSHTPHECRHTFVSMLDDAGANKVSIQKIAGHKGSDVTEKVYTHKNIEQLLSAIDLLKV